MKKFLVNSSIFLILLTILTSLIVLVFEKKLGAMTNSYTLKRTQLESQADSIEVLVLGSSQSLYGVNPAYFRLRGYNASNTSQSLFYDVHITLKYIDKMPHLKYVFIAINDLSLGYQLIDGKEKWRDYFYSQCLGIKFPEIRSTDMYLHSKILLYTPEMSLAYALKLFHVNLVKGYYLNGWARIPNSEDINDRTAYNRVMDHNALYQPKRYESIKETLDTLLSILKKRNVTPVFFTPPVSSAYYKNAVKEKVDIMYKTITDFCNKYGCIYRNYFTDNRFQNTDFGDCDHLNSSGAEKLSKILNNDILSKGDTNK